MRISGAEAMVQCLKLEGIPVVFGYPGATIAPFYDSLGHSEIRHILTRSEQGAGHAASGYARITGRPGVCVVTSGPGATNLFTAIATAYSDSIPMVAITGQVATHQLGRDVFQEVDTTGAAEPFTKYSYLVKSASDLPRVFKEAFHIASTGRKGPVLIDVPVDVQREMLDFAYPEGVSIRGYKPPQSSGHPMQIRKVAQALKDAKRPLICAGGGVFLSGASQTVRAFAERLNLPVVSTLMGVGVMPSDHPNYFGMLGMTGTTTGNAAVTQNDLLVLIGARAGDRAITQPGSLEQSTTVVHIDIDTAEIGKNMGTTIPLVGDASDVLTRLSDLVTPGDWSEWLTALDALREQERARNAAKKTKPGFVSPGAFVRMLCEKLPPNSVYVADVGQNQIWSAKNFSASGRFLTTGGMGTMGYSIPAAVGAKTADPARCVVAVCGDGAFQMSMNELATMRQHGIPVKVVVMRNGMLGMVLSIQRTAYAGHEVAVDLSGSPDIGMIAAAYGMRHALVTSLEEAEKAVAQMVESPDSWLLECAIDPEEETL